MSISNYTNEKMLGAMVGGSFVLGVFTPALIAGIMFPYETTILMFTAGVISWIVCWIAVSIYRKVACY